MAKPATNRPPAMNDQPHGPEHDVEQGLSPIGGPTDGDETSSASEPSSERARWGDEAYGSAIG